MKRRWKLINRGVEIFELETERSGLPRDQLAQQIGPLRCREGQELISNPLYASVVNIALVNNDYSTVSCSLLTLRKRECAKLARVTFPRRLPSATRSID